MPDKDIRQLIVDEAHRFLNVKWVHQGRRPDAVDCAGLIVLIAKKFNLAPVDFKDFTNYGRQPNGFDFKTVFDTNMDKIPFMSIKNGDVAVFGAGRYACHCGILFYENGSLYMIHAYAERGKVVKEPFTPYWRKLLKGVYKYKGV